MPDTLIPWSGLSSPRYFPPRLCSDLIFQLKAALSPCLILEPASFMFVECIISIPCFSCSMYLWKIAWSADFFFFFFFLRWYLRHMEVPRLGVSSELHLSAYATATARRDLSHVCDLHHSSWPCWVLNPPSEARDQTHVLWLLVWFSTRWATMGTLIHTLYFPTSLVLHYLLDNLAAVPLSIKRWSVIPLP